jgi:hypothetical protein
MKVSLSNRQGKIIYQNPSYLFREHADLRSTGTTAPIGVEVFSDVLDELAPEEVGRQAGAALRSLLAPPP